MRPPRPTPRQGRCLAGCGQIVSCPAEFLTDLVESIEICVAPFLVPGTGMTETCEGRSTRNRSLERLCLALAFFGTLLCIGAIYGNMLVREMSSNDMPVFRSSKPAVADWPRHTPSPRI